MIRQTLRQTQAATFSVDLPDAALNGMPRSYGTGFFVSADGWFVTAAHVVTKNNQSDGEPRDDIAKGWLEKELRLSELSPEELRLEKGGAEPRMARPSAVDFIDSRCDFALMKVPFPENAARTWLQGEIGFPFVHVSTRRLAEGEPVYSFGYPLGDAQLTRSDDSVTIGVHRHRPRVTSAIVASTLESTEMVMSSTDVQRYVLDKALNYGNSGGPIIATETGRAHAFCSRFQPVPISQPHLGPDVRIKIPSLYGIAVSLANPAVLAELQRRGVPIDEV